MQDLVTVFPPFGLFAAMVIEFFADPFYSFLAILAFCAILLIMPTHPLCDCTHNEKCLATGSAKYTTNPARDAFSTIGHTVASLFKPICSLLVSIPATTLEWASTTFTMVWGGLEGKHILVKIILFIGVMYAMSVSAFAYVVFFYPVVGLEKLWMWYAGDQTIEAPDRFPHENNSEIDEQLGGEKCGRAPTDDISELDLGEGVEVEGHEVEEKTIQEVITEVCKWDNGANGAENGGSEAAGVVETVA